MTLTEITGRMVEIELHSNSRMVCFDIIECYPIHPYTVD